MTTNRLRSLSLAGAAAMVLAASASAANITYNTNSPATGFAGTSLSLSSSSGVAATLVFTPNGNSSTGVPSNVNFGVFTLTCNACGSQATFPQAGAIFDPFTFDLVITDVTAGNAMGTFVGTSTGGQVFSDVSGITINWAPLQLGPGTNNASSGSFGTNVFSTTMFTGIAAPNSGTPPGTTTIQGFVTAIPEPATTVLVGAALLILGLSRSRCGQSLR